MGKGYSGGGSSKGSTSTPRIGKTHVPIGAKSGKGAGVNARDSAKATGTPSGGGTLKYRSGDVKRSSGSFKGYK